MWPKSYSSLRPPWSGLHSNCHFVPCGVVYILPFTSSPVVWSTSYRSLRPLWCGLHPTVHFVPCGVVYILLFTSSPVVWSTSYRSRRPLSSGLHPTCHVVPCGLVYILPFAWSPVVWSAGGPVPLTGVTPGSLIQSNWSCRCNRRSLPCIFCQPHSPLALLSKLQSPARVMA